MKVTEKDVAYVAELANLDLTSEEQSRMLHDLNSILDYIDRLNELNTNEVVPVAQVTDRPGADSFREDVRYGLRESLPHDTALKNAPETDGTFFEVPKVIER
jgi:aspartyl-tRNA(Asn)/glutamyl-tRNA(Gln) amidotransferase subunit C